MPDFDTKSMGVVVYVGKMHMHMVVMIERPLTS